MPSQNPYEGNEKLSRLEADVLWEYAKLAENMRQVSVVADFLVVF